MCTCISIFVDGQKTVPRFMLPGMSSLPGLFGGPLIAKPTLPPPPRIEPKPTPPAR